MTEYCTNCGAKNDDSAKFCSKCGNELKSHKLTETKSSSDFKKIIGLLIIIIALLIIGITIFSQGFANIPLESHDFGGIIMLVQMVPILLKHHHFPTMVASEDSLFTKMVVNIPTKYAM